MTDKLLADANEQEALSLVYARALAARARYTTSAPEPDIDSVDLKILAGGEMRPALDLQMKATVNLGQPRDGFLSFRLKIKNYNDLRIPTQTPPLLVVLDLPKDKIEWMTVTENELALRRRAYWLSLRGLEESTNKEDVTVHIPGKNLFNVESLRALMEQSRRGEI